MTNETEMIHHELELLSEVEALRAKITESRQARRTFAVDGDAESVQKAQQAYDEAKATVQETKEALSEQEALLPVLAAKQKSGDRSVTSANVREVKDEIETLTNWLGHDEKVLQQAKRTLTPLLADQHLANLAADALESVTDVPVIVRRKPANAPEVSPALVLSQTEATEDYGTLDASGSVAVTGVGESGIDWSAVKAALESTGSEVAVTKTGITFDRAAWPVPRLSEPSTRGIGSWMSTFEEAWGLQVSGAREAERLRSHGYNARVKTLWAGLFDRATTDLEHEDGKAVGTATFRVSAQQDNGISMEVGDLEAELVELLRVFREETVGTDTEAGEIVSVSMSDVKAVRFDWPETAVARRMGGAIQPTTAEATITIEFVYSPAEEAA